ncbi:MAG: hypothetical protein QHJ73_01860, partial [Armatimonadota bacterium]|nr:hypothetical protein [Armatimonadota bacterium]
DSRNQLINNYGMNQNLYGRKLATINEPASLIALGDALHWSGTLYNGLCFVYAGNTQSGWFDPRVATNQTEYRTRHMGGSNLGYADGHAKWVQYSAIQASLPASITP